MNEVSGQIKEFFSIGAIWLLFSVNMSKKISLSVECKIPKYYLRFYRVRNSKGNFTVFMYRNFTSKVHWGENWPKEFF